MYVRNTFYLLTSAIVLLMGTAAAHANLIGVGNTVNEFFFAPDYIAADAGQDINADTGMVGPSPIGPAGTSFGPGATDGVTIDVGTDPGHSEIVITSNVSGAFCFGSQCPAADLFDGFKFIFTGTNITGVSVDPASAADFQPITAPVFNAATQDILVNITNDSPMSGDQLILDLTFPGGSTGIPEPPSLALFASALVGCLMMCHRDDRRLRWLRIGRGKAGELGRAG